MGGLGIRKLHHMNLAFMTKLGWRLMEEKDSLWAQVLKCKHTHNNPISSEIKQKESSSNAWQGIFRCIKFLEQESKKLLRNGRTITFWMDKWLGDEPLVNSLLTDIDPDEKQKNACDYWLKGEGWNWESLKGGYLPKWRMNWQAI